jgi:peroxiredoxin
MTLYQKLGRIISGKRNMTDLAAGSNAPEFTLNSLEGKEYSLQDLLAHGPVVLAFFKVSCPVCQFTFPFLQRLSDRFKTTNFTMVGISQDDSRSTRQFNEEHGVRFLTLIDSHPYPISNAYTLTSVPTIFLVESDGTITLSGIGFSKSDLEQITDNLETRNKLPTVPFFRPDEIVPAYKPG